MAETVLVGEKEYVVVKTGRAQAEQVLNVSKWIATHGMAAVSNMEQGGKDIQSETGLEFLWEVINSLTPDALIDMFIVVTGCTKEEAELYFDISVLVDAVVLIYEKQPAVRRLIERFFSTPASAPEPQVE